MKSRDETQIYDLAGRIIGAAMAVHTELGCGFVESVYQNSLALELADLSLDFDQYIKLSVFYKGRIVGDFEADMAIGKELLIELKAVSTLTIAHEVQLVNYLKATKIPEGLLVNFGAESLQFRKKFLKKKPTPPSQIQ
jgi:GxxExxY protein